MQGPSWLRPFTHAIRVFILQHQSGGLFLVIYLQELGVPLPAPVAHSSDDTADISV